MWYLGTAMHFNANWFTNWCRRNSTTRSPLPVKQWTTRKLSSSNENGHLNVNNKKSNNRMRMMKTNIDDWLDSRHCCWKFPNRWVKISFTIFLLFLFKSSIWLFINRRKNQSSDTICSWICSICFDNSSNRWLAHWNHLKNNHIKSFPSKSKANNCSLNSNDNNDGPFFSIFDTKHICNQKFRNEISNSTLGNVFEAVSQAPFKLPNIGKWNGEIIWVKWFNNWIICHFKEPASPEYGYTDVKEHEAGYDSYMTGICFIGLARKLNINNADISSKSPQLRPLLNK